MESPVRGVGMSVRVIETFGYDGRFQRLDRHLARAAATCAGLGYPFERMDVLVALDALPHAGPLRVRMTVGSAGDVEVTHAPMTATPDVWRVAVSDQRLVSDDPWLQVKTTERGLYDRVRAGMAAGVEEVIFLNERGAVCEGTITNIFFDAGEGLCTPPLACGLLPGVLRAEMLENGVCREAVLRGEDLARVKRWVGNSLRGMIVAKVIE